MNRRQRIAHERRMKEWHEKSLELKEIKIQGKETNLFDKVHSKMLNVPMRVSSIYESVFCRG